MTSRNTLEAVRAIGAAAERVRYWTNAESLAVQGARPDWVPLKDYRVWAVTVELARRPHETAVAAAERMALYLTLHRELGTAPGIVRTQERAAADRADRDRDEDQP